MAVEPLDFEALIGSWRRAFEAARRALEACRHDLPAPETAARSHRLADERAATARVLDSFARERQMKQFLVRLVATSWESKRLLGVPTDAVACVFNVDGVLVPSAAIHAEAWKATFDELIVRLIERTGVPFPTFSMVVDYPRLVHGRSRLASVHEFLASRGITMPDGSPDDAPGTETTYGTANRKNEALLEASTEAPEESSSPITGRTPSRVLASTSSSFATHPCDAPWCLARPTPGSCANAPTSAP